MANPYLQKLHGIIGARPGPNLKVRHPEEPTKLTKLGSVSFGSDQRSRVFGFEANARNVEVCNIADTKTQENASPANRQNPPGYGRVFAALCERCPAHIDPVRWRQAIEDGECFLTEWGEQAEALGWTARDLLGLHEPPSTPHPTYQRLSRYDCLGLIWLLQGCHVMALTDTTAAIKSPATGSITTYRRLDAALGNHASQPQISERAQRLVSF